MEFGNCKHCGAPNVKNPKTGKIFCQNKCWLNGSGSQKIAPKPQGVANFDKFNANRNEDIKEHMAIKLAFEAWVAGKIQKDDIKTTAQWIYTIRLLRENPKGDIQGDADLMF
ncbi:hypothetical protein M0R04_12950 [Candidatus Dojkabacteria bacterium]|jgi:hypothetical protein|nr:hypothetical protein [Candidatus Dojkabacteria bacterium]